MSGLITIGLSVVGNLGGEFLIGISAQPENPGYRTQGSFQFGNIVSIQNDNEGNRAWLLSGHWKSNLLNMSGNEQANASVFSTSFEMTMLDGENSHTHALTNFNLANKSIEQNSTQVFTGTSSVSLREGMAQGIPTTIKFIDDKLVTIWVDPAKVENHFGDTPIYGTISSGDDSPKRIESNSTWNQ
ncbi:MAG TPA: hypothetical protein VE594_05160 [Nitrososphaeraceae archaeon]|nr:hypothetical protein [Nitrososphaeraceae archaeon]